MNDDYADEDKVQQKIYEEEEARASLIELVQSPSLEKNLIPTRGMLHPDMCLICGKHTPNPKYGVSWLTQGLLIPPQYVQWFAHNDDGFMGEYPVGSNCARLEYLKPVLVHANTNDPVWYKIEEYDRWGRVVPTRYRRIKYEKT